jgi:hypothetical protein
MKLKSLENRIRGWLPKEPNLPSFRGTAGNQALKPRMPQTQAEKELYATVKFEIDKWPRWLTYIGLIAYPIIGVAVFFTFYSPLSSDFTDSIASLPFLIWFILLYFAQFHIILMQFRKITKVKQALNEALIPAAQAMLSYYDVSYKNQKNMLLFNFYVVLVLMAYWFFGTMLHYWTWNSSSSFLYYLLFGLSAALCLVTTTLIRRDKRNKKAKIQNILSQLTQQP